MSQSKNKFIAFLSKWITKNNLDNFRLILSAENTHQTLQEMLHPSQLEKRYGGEADDLTSYWPPQFRSSMIYLTKAKINYNIRILTSLISDEFGHNPDLICQSESSDEKEEIKMVMIPQTKEGNSIFHGLN